MWLGQSQQKTPSHPQTRCFINHLLLSPKATLPFSWHSKPLLQGFVVFFSPFSKALLPSYLFVVFSLLNDC